MQSCSKFNRKSAKKTNRLNKFLNVLSEGVKTGVLKVF